MSVVFARGSSGRKPEFLTTTTIEEVGGKRFVQKSPAHVLAANHVSSMIDKRALLLSAGISCDVASAQKTGNGVRFDFIDGTSLEDEFIRAFMSNDAEHMALLIEEVFSVIDSLPVVKINPSNNRNFRKFFGNNYDAEMACVKPGCIDMNLDNFIRTKNGKLTLIDYEWVFDFAIPVNFIKTRLLHALFSELRLTVLKKPADFKLIEFAKNCYIPEAVYSKYSDILSDYEAYVLTNYAFLNAVQIVQSSTPELLKPQEKTVAELEPENPFLTFEGLKALRTTLELTQQHAEKLEAALKEAVESRKSIRSSSVRNISRLDKKIRRIASSKFKKSS